MDTELNNYSFELSEFDSEIVPYDEQFNLSDQEKYKKLELSASQKMQISALAANIPNIIESSTLSNAYSIHFPKGLPHTLTALKQGGYGTMIKNNEGRFAASASMEPLAKQSAVLSGFTAMSIISGQYFLKQINTELESLHSKLEKIIFFLEEDKRADLNAKIDFAQYAYIHFSQIMANTEQRIATIVNLQQIKMSSNANIHFYISYYDNNTNNSKLPIIGKNKEKKNKIEDKYVAEQFYSNVTSSLDLYILSSFLEICYSQNIEEEYINNIANNIDSKIEYVKSQMISILSPLKSSNKNNISSDMKIIATELSENKHPFFIQKKEFTNSFISNFKNMICFYITKNGDLYINTEKRT